MIPPTHVRSFFSSLSSRTPLLRASLSNTTSSCAPRYARIRFPAPPLPPHRPRRRPLPSPRARATLFSPFFFFGLGGAPPRGVSHCLSLFSFLDTSPPAALSSCLRSRLPLHPSVSWQVPHPEQQLKLCLSLSLRHAHAHKPRTALATPSPFAVVSDVYYRRPLHCRHVPPPSPPIRSPASSSPLSRSLACLSTPAPSARLQFPLLPCTQHR